MKKFDSINIGDSARISHTITSDDINKFVDLTGDDNKLHVDEEFASSTSFGKPVVHGMLGASFISTVIGTKLPGDGALWYAQSLEFLLPVRLGDELLIVAEVTDKISRMQAIELKTEIFNQHRQKVTTGSAKVKVVDAFQSEAKTDTKYHKTALVIGATGGIGQATCIQLAKDGFDLAIHYFKNSSRVDQLKDQIEEIGGKAIVVSGNITSLSDVREIKEKSTRFLGFISVIVNCATISVPIINFQNLDWKDIQAHIDINIKGAFNLLKIFIPIMEKEKFGKFIALTTLYTENPNEQLTHYITAKTALNGFFRSLVPEMGPKGIRINLVSPGMVETPLIADVPEKARLLSAANTPLRNLASPQDVAGAISFLASEKSNHITGETIRVNGGQFML